MTEKIIKGDAIVSQKAISIDNGKNELISDKPPELPFPAISPNEKAISSNISLFLAVLLFKINEIVTKNNPKVLK